MFYYENQPDVMMLSLPVCSLLSRIRSLAYFLRKVSDLRSRYATRRIGDGLNTDLVEFRSYVRLNTVIVTGEESSRFGL